MILYKIKNKLNKEGKEKILYGYKNYFNNRSCGIVNR